MSSAPHTIPSTKMPAILCWLSPLLALLLCTSTPAIAKGQVLTVGAVLAAGNLALDKLADISVMLTGNAQVAVNQSAGQLSGLLHQLDDLTNHNVAAPITSLSNNARVLAEKLTETTRQLDNIVSKQRACIFQNLDLFIAAVSTAVAGAKAGIPFFDPGAPRLVSFKVDGLITPNLIPKSGGTVRIQGFRLWEVPEYMPLIQLQNSSAATLATLPARTGANSGEAVVTLDGSLLTGHAGECLSFDVHMYGKKKFLGIPVGRRLIGEASLPICVPAEYERGVSMTAVINYSTTNQGTKILSGKRFGWGNADCSNKHDVTMTQAWDNEIPAGWRITRVGESDVDIRNTTSVSITFLEKSVTAAGWLDEATCFDTPISHTFFHDTHWYETLTPLIAGSVTVEHQESKSTEPISMSLPSTRVCASIPKDAAASGPSNYQVTVWPYLRGEKQPSALYVGPWRQDPDMNAISHQDQGGGYDITTSYNPSVVQGNCEVCATITPRGNCSW